MTLRPVRDLGQLKGPLLIFGGPYSNYAATEAVHEISRQRGIPPEQVVCTGDLVAYCAEPEETVGLIRDWGVHVVMGNCEQSLADRAVDCGCGFEDESTCSALSAEWFRYADGQLAEEHRLWMGSLPQILFFQLAGRRLAVVHGAVSRINRFLFASTSSRDKLGELELLDRDVDGIVAGHCGIPFGQMVAGKAWLNAGVIGLPANDGTQDGWYLVIEEVAGSLQAVWHRLNYAAEQSRQKMLEAGLAMAYADTLINGLWPSEDVLPGEEKSRRGKALNPAPVVF